MTSARPLVSVLVATYNGEDYLREALDCLENQTYRNLEVIVRDDHSTDATLAIAGEYAARDPRFRVVTHDGPGGGFDNYINLAKLARGEFIKYLNQDDVLDIDCIETLIAPMLQTPSITISTSTRRLIDGAGNELPPEVFTQPLIPQSGVIDGSAVAGYMLAGLINQIGEPSTVLYRNGLIDPDHMFEYAGQKYLVNCDVALWLNLFALGNLYFHVPPLSSFRRHGEQYSARPMASIRGTVEWADFYAVGVAEGLIDAQASVHTARQMLAMLQQMLVQVMSSADAELNATVPDVAEAIARTWRVGTGSMTPVLK